jgi:hypothetical protein
MAIESGDKQGQILSMNSNEKVEETVSLFLRIKVADGNREGRHVPQTDCDHRGDNDMGFDLRHLRGFIDAPDQEL